MNSPRAVLIPYNKVYMILDINIGIIYKRLMERTFKANIQNPLKTKSALYCIT